MLHNLLITYGRGSIVLFRKALTKTLSQPPTLVAGLITAVIKLSTKSVGLPVSYLELDDFALTVVEDAGIGGGSGGGAGGEGADTLRCVCFHDVDDGELYGRIVGRAALRRFRHEYSQTLASVVLARAAGVEAMFKAYGWRLRAAIDDAAQEAAAHLEQTYGVRQALLVRVRGQASVSVCNAAATAAAALLGDLQGLLHAADDVLAMRVNSRTTVISLGPCVRIHRLTLGTLVVVTQAPTTCNSVAADIDSTVNVLQRLFTLITGLQGGEC